MPEKTKKESLRILQIGTDNMPSGSANNRQVVHMSRAFRKIAARSTLISFKRRVGYFSLIHPIFQEKNGVFGWSVGANSNVAKRYILRVLVWIIRPSICFTRIPAYAAILSKFHKSVGLELHNPLKDEERGQLVKSPPKLIICMSSFIHEQVSQLQLQATELLELNQGFDKINFDKYRSASNVVTTRTGISTYVLFYGSVAPLRGIELIYECADILPDINFVIAGKVAGNYELPDRQPRNVYIVGHLSSEESPRVLSDASVHLVPYSSQISYANRLSSSLRLIELMYSGRPILISDLEGVRKNSLMHKFTDVFVPADDASVWSRRISSLVQAKTEFNSEMSSYAQRMTWDARAQTIISHLAN